MALFASLIALWLASQAGALSSSATLPVFSDGSERSGISMHLEGSPTAQKYLLETMPGGVAMLDYDGDGFEDLYFTNGALLADPMLRGAVPDKADPKFWNRLYRNNHDGTYTDVTVKAGVQGDSFAMGVTVADYDNDGHPDLFVTGFGHNTLYHNNGDGTFTDVTQKAGVAGSGWSTGAAFLDYDRDGRLDLFVVRYLNWDFSTNLPCGAPERGQRAYCHPDSFRSATYLLYHNNGDGTFTDLSVESRISSAPGRGLGVAINDYDNDGWPDILVANDAIAEQLFHNNHNGTFTEVGLQTGLAYDEDGQAFSGMGVAFEDYDNDGWPDVFIDDLANQRYALFRNLKQSFRYISGPSGVGSVSMAHSGWGAGLFDYDNDGWKDLFVAQSHVMDNIAYFQPSVQYREPLSLLRNNVGHFEDVSAQSGPVFSRAMAARGVALGDLNNDGQTDLVVTRLAESPLVLLNSGSSNHHWITISTVGGVSNRDGIGARIHITPDSGTEQFATVSGAGSYLSCSDRRVHFGLGVARRIRTLEIRWPSGIRQTLHDIAADQFLTVREPPPGARP